MSLLYSTNVHVPSPRGPAVRLHLAARESGSLLWVVRYVAGEIDGCGASLVMLNAAERELAETRLHDFPDFWMPTLTDEE